MGLNVDGALVGAFGLARHLDMAWADDELATVRHIAETMANLLSRERADRARLNSECHLKAILSNVRDILLVVDRNGIVRYVNQTAKASTGHDAEDIVGKPFLPIVHPEDAPIAVECFAATIDARTPLSPTELRLVSPNGTAEWYDVDSSGVEDPVLGGYVMLLRDVSGQHAQAENARRQHDQEEVVLELSRWALDVEFENIEAELTGQLRKLTEVLHADRSDAWLVDGATIQAAAQWSTEGTDGKMPHGTAVNAPSISATRTPPRAPCWRSRCQWPVSCSV